MNKCDNPPFTDNSNLFIFAFRSGMLQLTTVNYLISHLHHILDIRKLFVEEFYLISLTIAVSMFYWNQLEKTHLSLPKRELKFQYYLFLQ